MRIKADFSIKVIFGKMQNYSVQELLSDELELISSPSLCSKLFAVFFIRFNQKRKCCKRRKIVKALEALNILRL